MSDRKPFRELVFLRNAEQRAFERSKAGEQRRAIENSYANWRATNRMIAGQAARAERHGNAADGFALAMETLHDASVRYALSRQLDRPELRRQVRALLDRHPGHGVLLYVLFKWYPTQGGRAIKDVFVGIAGHGVSPVEPYARYRNAPRLVSALDRGWQRGEQFLWLDSMDFDPQRTTVDLSGVNTNMCVIDQGFDPKLLFRVHD